MVSPFSLPEGLGQRRFHGRVAILVNESTKTAGVLCVARTLPVPLATLLNGEPGGHAAGGGRVVNTISDYLKALRPVQTNVPGRSQRFCRRDHMTARAILGFTIR